MKSRRSALAGRVALVALGLAAASAGWLAPYPPDLQEDIAGARYLPPWTDAHAVPRAAHRVWIVTALHRLDDGWAAERAGRRIELSDEDVAAATSRFYLLGTDRLGRDLASRLIYGTRHSVVIASIGVALSIAIGLTVGAVAGFASRSWDFVFMRGVDVVLAVPRLLLFLFLATFFSPSLWLLVLVLGATTWPGLARLVRAEVMVLRATPLVEAARAAGGRPSRILLSHLVPQLGPLLSVSAALRFADIVLLESALSFIGLGVPPPSVSLGGMLAMAHTATSQAWWLLAFPGAVLVALVLGTRLTVSSLFSAADPPSVL